MNSPIDKKKNKFIGHLSSILRSMHVVEKQQEHYIVAYEEKAPPRPDFINMKLERLPRRPNKEPSSTIDHLKHKHDENKS